MALRLIIALTALAAVSAAPLSDIRSALFCESWSPLGTSYSTDDLYDYYCSASQDGRSLTLRVISKEREDTYKYLMMAAVDSAGNGMDGTYKIDSRLRTVSCEDKTKRVIKVSDDDINDMIATYTLPEDSEMKLDEVNCRFAVAQGLEEYQRSVTIDMFGKVKGETVAEKTPAVEEQPTVEVEEPTVEVEEPTVEVEEPTVEVTQPTQEVEPFPEVEQPFVDDNENSTLFTTEETNNTTFVEELEPTRAPVVEPIVEATTEETEFEPRITIDETENLQTKFDRDEKLGHETKPEETVPVVTAPEVPEETAELTNEGEEEEPEYMVDEFGIRRMIIPEKEKKLIYKGISTGYWCEDMGNTYIMAPGTDCQMFYQTIMKEEDHNEVFPLASFNCAPGTRFNTFKCTCTLFDGMMCPDPNANFKTTTEKEQITPIFTGTVDTTTDSSNSTDY